jgi:hypothetical protein
MRGTDTNLGYSRANQDLVNRRGGEMFLSPFSTLTDEAKNTGALKRGTPASAALSTAAFIGDLLNPSFGLPIGVGGGQAAATVAPRIKPAFQNPEVYMQSLLRQIMDNPNTRISTVRSMNSMDDIIGGSGAFKSSRTTGTSGAHNGLDVPSDYNIMRETLENEVDPNSADFVYGAVTSPVLRDIPAPFPFFSRGRENFLNYQKLAQNMDPYDTAINYGKSGGTSPRVPMRYEWGPEATANASLSWGDSLRGAPFFNTLDDFKAAIDNGMDTVESASSRGNWNWITQNQPRVSIPPYIEAQIPNLGIDDISRITALADRPSEAAAQGMKIVNALTNAGKEIPVSAQSFNVPGVVNQAPFEQAGILDELFNNPAYANILDSIRTQREDFLPPNLINAEAPFLKNILDITNRGYRNYGSYRRPDWATGHMLNKVGENPNNLPSSAVAQGLQNFYAQQINPRLQAFQRALFPEVSVPRPRTGAFADDL